jgi:phosphoserine phosphatase RsbU/P
MPEVQYSLLRSQLWERRQRLESAAVIQRTKQLVHLLQEVDAALERMDRGTYGLCAECHDPIEAERLLADPLVTLCLDHLSAQQRRALEQDLDLASRLQGSLLPGRDLRTGPWQTSYFYEPAGPVSGDYCDLIAPAGLADGLFFATGDVSGKGVAAALLMSQLHAVFRSLLSLEMPLIQMVQRANRLLCESTPATHYATLACGRAWPSGEVEICNAGHCPAVLIAGGSSCTLEAGGLPLGLFSDSEYSSSRLALRPGESLVLYTDGLTEAHNPTGEEYGLQRLCEMLMSCNSLSAQGLVNAATGEWKGFTGNVSNADDVTLMVIRHSVREQG